MTCDDYRRLYHRNTSYPLAQEVWQTAEYRVWQVHGFGCTACNRWDLEQRVAKQGYRVADFPCLDIAYRLTETCHQHPDPWQCPDVLVVYRASMREYGLPIRDGAHSMVVIHHCPWCGIALTPLPIPWSE